MSLCVTMTFFVNTTLVSQVFKWKILLCLSVKVFIKKAFKQPKSHFDAILKWANVLPLLFIAVKCGSEGLRHKSGILTKGTNRKMGTSSCKCSREFPVESKWASPSTGKRGERLEEYSAGVCFPHLQNSFLFSAMMQLLTAAIEVADELCSIPWLPTLLSLAKA